MHLTRLAIAVIVLPLLYLLVRYAPLPLFLLLLMTVSVIAQSEFYRMYRAKRPFALLGMLGGIALLAGPLLLHAAEPPFPLNHAYSLTPLIVTFMLIASARLFLVRDPGSSLADVSPVIAGIFYIPVLLLAQLYLRLKGYEWLVLLYTMVWTADSFAYYLGKGFGKKRLYPAMSPKKTWVGAYGSVIGGIVAAAVFGTLLAGETPFLALLIMGAVIGAVTIVGDLVESMFKRDAGVKDSSALVPGHGGLLDKIDSALFAGPVLYWMTLLL